MLLTDATALHGALQFWKAVGEEDEIILDLPEFGKFDAKLLLVDVVDKFRAVEPAVVELECQVVGLAQILCILDFDVFPAASLDPVLSVLATGDELVQGG